MHIKFWLENRKGRNHSEDLAIDREEDDTGMDLREIGWEGVEWMHLYLDRDQWWDLLNLTLNLQVP
jgi:hypothetical protein